MSSWLTVVTALSSALIRIASFIFLRWIPGHVFPPVILTCSGLYLSSTFLILGTDAGAEVQKTTTVDKSKIQTRKHDTGETGSTFKSLLSGVPSKKTVFSTTLNILINLALTALTLDFLYRGRILHPTDDLAFSRIGYVSPTTANLLVREPHVSNFPMTIKYQEAAQVDSDYWVEEGKIYQLNAVKDFTFPVTIKNLKPSTQYRYSLSNNQTGTFITAPQSGTQSASRLSFLTSSCIKSNFPYNPLSHPLRILGVEELSHAIKKLPSLKRPSFMLFLGDFIYIDVPLRYGSSLEEYRAEYRRVYSSPSWHEPADEPPIDLPWIHTLDDHEIANDWDKGNLTHPYPEAVDPYHLYHVSVNPPIPPLPYATPENTTYFSFIHGPASIFMLDTRTYRTTANLYNSTMLGSAQLKSLLAFIARPEAAEVKWKIVASSVPFTKNWHVGTQDTWGGFLGERQVVLKAMWRAERELGVRIVLLSGDRHEFGATRFPDPSYGLSSNELSSGTADAYGIHEFSVGPLNMFYLPIRSYRQTDSEDIMVKYVPDGNIKFGQIDIELYDGTGGESDVVYDHLEGPHSVLTYSLHVDDKIIWKYQLSIPLLPDEIGTGAQARLPPGKVLLDDAQLRGWGLQEGIGYIEEKAKIAWDDLKERIAPFLSWERKEMRVD
ncbi:alkaline phosphatase family protein [Talaromyces stipitatus ATCC 10500]|uniref:Alkaline phosphatase family protein n=1 Tax=Talaromyces stipitatus (strain ATCC 10500 / CBS 375.48 / QM 6759 / NRRL 1006) TaxID=441959 RepID=B8M9M1_TALSN|nr:alkaline phosphatase family protein [Talaromyces stipitatus ATCC 10500]EED18023.1 alkaline phosphatase family protein [Talaromyces stipitatus ATCC 10500]